jgi:DNA-binding GntR family transcriptional regulator
MDGVRATNEAPAGAATERGSLREQVTFRLRDDIVTGRLRPGTRLAEERLGHRYFVSRSPVREALRVLEEEGLVASAGARRYVARLGERATDDLFELRAVIEPRAAARLAEAPAPAPLRDAMAVVLAGEQALTRRDLDMVAELNTRFHEQLVAAAAAPVLAAAYAPLALRMTWAHPRGRVTGLEDAWAEHRRILDAIVTGDVAEAERRTRSHLQRCRARFAATRTPRPLRAAVG